MTTCEHQIVMGGGTTHWYDCGDMSRECNACCPYCMYEKACPLACEHAYKPHQDAPGAMIAHKPMSD